jgi:hypothetical protein
MWNASQLYVTGVVSVRTAGDYNQDDSVDSADYVVWRKMLGQTGTGLAADGNGNGVIDSGDYDVWTANFGLTGRGAALSSTIPTVPEPISFVLFCFVSICGIASMRCRTQMINIASP